MIDTLTRPLATAAAVDLLAECAAVAALCNHPKAECIVIVSSASYLSSLGPVAVTVRPVGGFDVGEHFWGHDFVGPLTKAREYATSRPVIAREARVRSMALAILDLTDQHGRCDAAMLGRRDFGLDEVRELHRSACERAGEMAQGAPFSVEGVA